MDHVVAYSVRIAGVQFGTGDGEPLLLDILRPDPPPAAPLPAAIYIHGGGWQSGKRQDNRNAVLAAQGFFTVTIDYRLSKTATFPAALHDCKAAVRWLRAHADAYGVDAERIGVWGHSAGGHLAAMLGLTGGQAGVRRHGGQCGRFVGGAGGRLARGGVRPLAVPATERPDGEVPRCARP